jgi:trigger factor
VNVGGTNITLLCPNLHREKTSGRLTREQLRQWDQSPFNVRAGNKMSAPHELYFDGQEFVVWLGSNHAKIRGAVVSNVPIVRIDTARVLGIRFTDGGITLDAQINDADNRPSLRIRNSEITVGMTSWDTTFEGQLLTIKPSSCDPPLKIRFMPPDSIQVESGLLRANGAQVEIKGDELIIPSGDDGTSLTALRYNDIVLLDNADIVYVGPMEYMRQGAIWAGDPPRYQTPPGVFGRANRFNR